MGVTFNKPSKASKYYQILIPEAGKQYVVTIGIDASFWRTTQLHYVATLGRMVPCLNDECSQCVNHIPVRETTYVPSLVHYGQKVGWIPEILAVTDSWKGLLEEDLKNWLWKIQRKGGQSSRVIYAPHLEKTADVPEFKGFDLEPSLFRAWGIRGARKGDPGHRE